MAESDKEYKRARAVGSRGGNSYSENWDRIFGKTEEPEKPKGETMHKFRKVQKLQDGDWVDVEFEDLKVGDTFVLFESNGIPVPGGPWYVTQAPEPTDDGIEGNYGLQCQVI